MGAGRRSCRQCLAKRNASTCGCRARHGHRARSQRPPTGVSLKERFASLARPGCGLRRDTPAPRAPAMPRQQLPLPLSLVKCRAAHRGSQVSKSQAAPAVPRRPGAFRLLAYQRSPQALCSSSHTRWSVWRAHASEWPPSRRSGQRCAGE